MAPLRTGAVFPALGSDSASLYKYTELPYAGFEFRRVYPYRCMPRIHPDNYLGPPGSSA